VKSPQIAAAFYRSQRVRTARPAAPGSGLSSFRQPRRRRRRLSSSRRKKYRLPPTAAHPDRAQHWIASTSLIVDCTLYAGGGITLSLLLIVQIRVLPRPTLVHNMLWATIFGLAGYILYGIGLFPGGAWLRANVGVWGTPVTVLMPDAAAAALATIARRRKMRRPAAVQPQSRQLAQMCEGCSHQHTVCERAIPGIERHTRSKKRTSLL
jgi:hypothetical protein